MPKLSISEAARTANTTRSTLYRAMERGDVSFEILNGKRVIDPSELHRAFPPERPKVSRKTTCDTSTGQVDTIAEQVDLKVSQSVLQRENELLREQVRILGDDKQDLKKMLERSEIERSAALRQLEDKRDAQTKRADEAETERIAQLKQQLELARVDQAEADKHAAEKERAHALKQLDHIESEMATALKQLEVKNARRWWQLWKAA